jgi:hypothetical protein
MEGTFSINLTYIIMKTFFTVFTNKPTSKKNLVGLYHHENLNFTTMSFHYKENNLELLHLKIQGNCLELFH